MEIVDVVGEEVVEEVFNFDFKVMEDMDGMKKLVIIEYWYVKV